MSTLLGICCAEPRTLAGLMTGTCYQVDWDLFPACRNEGPILPNRGGIRRYRTHRRGLHASTLGWSFPNNADRLQEDALSNVSIVASSPERRAALPQRVLNCAGHPSLYARALDHMSKQEHLASDFQSRGVELRLCRGPQEQYACDVSAGLLITCTSAWT
ncbi:hypothetical protein OH76DRAFT_698532 [Lentinus brumalis]|uniref:Uncharacterized protein n=1 Tax=Lentinus brumalis TaxID=2498619 RepID=A0A371D6C0_9APHY|nr:hypothetical protein OH76DRAFT_698532 [Polyporus brumalis]